MKMALSKVFSDEGQMEWVESNRLSEINTVDDFAELIKEAKKYIF